MSIFLHSYSFTKQLRRQTVSREKKLLYEKVAQKMLMKLTAVVDFANILRASFCIFYQQITNPNCKLRKTLKYKKSACKLLVILSPEFYSSGL